MKRLLWTISLVLLATPARAGERTAPIGQRFASPDSAETPSFRKHVVPLLGKLGCNGRSCHGSFQGQGGFRLSLFGYDFQADHQALTGGEDPRVDLESPEQSLMLEKPTTTIPHEGGRRMALDSWQYRVLLNWIRRGAKLDAYQNLKLVGLDVTPTEFEFGNKGQTAQLSVVARWSDGTTEDVTQLARYRSNNDQIATVDDQGLVTADGLGDSHVVVFYDEGIVPVAVIRPVSNRLRDRYPNVPTPTTIDTLVVDKLRRLGIVPSELCTDTEFLRRASLDVTGTLPTPDEIKAFLDDASLDKRTRKIDELLQRPAYAAWWTTRLCDITGNNASDLAKSSPIRGAASREWYDWIYRRVLDNVPYDKLVAGIVLATNRSPDQSYEDYAAQMSSLYQPGSEKSYADLPGLQHFWARGSTRTADGKALSFAYAFLGVRIQCAECHKHPFDRWTKDDFKQFSNLFERVRFGIGPDEKKAYQALLESLELKAKKGGERRREIARLLKDGKTIPFDEVYVDPGTGRTGKNSQRVRSAPITTGRLLAGETIDLDAYDDPRSALMAWLEEPENPYFARAFVNRVWAAYFGVGIVEPPDDLSLANPPTNKALLDYLARGFIRNGYDMKWLHREIVGSRTYQLSSRPNETNASDERNFSRAMPRRLPAEVVVDAVRQATASNRVNAAMPDDMEGRAIYASRSDDRRVSASEDFALSIFGKSTRETNCDCDRSSEPSLMQTIYMMNDNSIETLIDPSSNGWVEEVAKEYGLLKDQQPRRDKQNKRDKPAARERRKDNSSERQIAQLRAKIRRLARSGQSNKADALKPKLRRLLDRASDEAKPPIESKRPLRPSIAPGATSGSGKPRSIDLQAIVRQAYLRTLSRFPAEDEAARAVRFVEQTDDTIDGLRGLLWALLNTKEFIVNH